MKVLVTGATGFIGKHLLLALRENGHDIVALVRDPKSAGVRLAVACPIYQWDPAGDSPPAEAFDGVRAVIHLTGENVAAGLWTGSRKRRILKSRIESTRKLVQTIANLESKPETFISASAIGYYGDRGEQALDEHSSQGEGFLAEVCRDWETETFKARDLGLRTVALRIGIVLGNHGGAMKNILPPFRLGLGGPLGGGKQWMSWIHVRDVARLMVYAVENNSLEGPVNAVSPYPVTNREFSKTLGRVLHRPVFLPAPTPALKLVLGEMSSLLLASQKVSSGKVQDSGFKFQYPRLNTALTAICNHMDNELLMEQWVPLPIHQAFDFFSDVKNLETLTPEFLKFKVLSKSTDELQDGTQINYRLQLHGFPVRWQSTIIDWKPTQGFADIQTRGPYAYWYHRHEFEEQDGGTLIRDKATYRIPFWVFGEILASATVRKDLESIFSYRREKIEELLGGRSGKI